MGLSNLHGRKNEGVSVIVSIIVFVFRYRFRYRQAAVEGPAHCFFEGEQCLLQLAFGLRQLELALGLFGLHLHDVGVSLASQFLFALGFEEGAVSGGGLQAQHLDESVVVHYLVVGLHRGQAHLVGSLPFLGESHLLLHFGDTQPVDGLEAVEQRDARREGIAVVEGGEVGVGVGFGVEVAAVLVVGVALRADAGREGAEDGLHLFGTLVAAVSGGEAHLGGVAYGVVHTVRQAHRLSVDRAAAEGEAKQKEGYCFTTGHFLIIKLFWVHQRTKQL